MSTQQIQRKKPKKTFDEIIQEIENILRHTKSVYIDMMAEALKYEHQDWENIKIQETIEDVCINRFGWKPNTVYNYLPSWIHDQKKVQREKEKWEKRHEQQKKKAEQNLFRIARDRLDDPRLPGIMGEDYNEEESDQFVGEPMFESYGDNVESALTLYGNINEPMNQLFYALTKKQLPDSDQIDLILEYLKPSRDFRKGIFYEIEKDMRISLYNAMTYTRDALNDTLRILDEIDKQ